jgi:hypothetical protein
LRRVLNLVDERRHVVVRRNGLAELGKLRVLPAKRAARGLTSCQLAAGGIELALLSGDLRREAGGLVALRRDHEHPACDD